MKRLSNKDTHPSIEDELYFRFSKRISITLISILLSTTIIAFADNIVLQFDYPNLFIRISHYSLAATIMVFVNSIFYKPYQVATYRPLGAGWLSAVNLVILLKFLSFFIILLISDYIIGINIFADSTTSQYIIYYFLFSGFRYFIILVSIAMKL